MPGKLSTKIKFMMASMKPSLPQDMWDQVQQKSNKYSISRNKEAQSERPKLFGKIWDYHGNRMTATYSYKYSKAGRYKMRYYQNQEIYRKGKAQKSNSVLLVASNGLVVIQSMITVNLY
jgi:nuclear transport factor 2 (NTF2) superfamily protein